MFSVPTVFIIGAGSGIELGMPDGRKLTTEIGNKLYITHKDGGPDPVTGDRQIAIALGQIANARGQTYNDWRKAAVQVASGLSEATSIDTFLDAHQHNEQMKVCGKLAIAQTILEYERKSSLYIKDNASDFINRVAIDKTWLPDFRSLIQHKIVVSKNLDQIFENLCIINFNYDRCIEHYLFHVLLRLYRIGSERAVELMGKLKIFHPYGQVGFLPWDSRGRRKVSFGVLDYYDLVGLSEEIRTFNEQLEDKTQIDRVRRELENALRIVFLGFHFHEQNMELLEVSQPGRHGDIGVFATALGRSAPTQAGIRAQIEQMLTKRSSGRQLHVDAWDCKGLFNEFGTMWLG